MFRVEQRRLMHCERESRRALRANAEAREAFSVASYEYRSERKNSRVNVIRAQSANSAASDQMSTYSDGMKPSGVRAMASFVARESEIIALYREKGEFKTIQPWLCSSTRISSNTKQKLPLAKGAFGEVYSVFLDSTPCELFICLFLC